MAIRSTKYFALYIVYFLLLMMFGALVFLASCSSDHYFEVPEQAPSGRPSMAIKISLGASSRADESPAPGFEVGEGLENYLDISNRNFRIYFFDEDNIFIDEFKPFIFPSSSSVTTVNGVQTIYYHEFRGEVPVDLPKKFKIVTLFNWPNYPQVKEAEGSEPFALVKGKTTISELCRHSDSQFAALTGEGSWLDVDSKRLIPFYGVREYDLEKYLNDGDITSDDKIKDGVYIDLSTPKDGSTATPIPILRAMAKVEVILTNSDLAFEKVEIDKYNPVGFCAPESALTHDGYDHDYDWNKDFVQDVHIPEGNPKDGMQLTKVLDSDVSVSGKPIYEKWIAYIPEYRNLVSDGSDCTLKVTLDKDKKPSDVSDAIWNAKEKTKTIYFAKNGLSENDRFDIWRNNIYRFTINATVTSISCIVDVQPYAVATLNPDFGLSRDADGNILVRDAKGKLIKVIPYDEAKPVSLKDVNIGDMSYVEVMYNDVIGFREFVDKDGYPDGRRQDFLTTGWNVYDKNGHMTACFIYNNELDPNESVHTVQVGRYMEFDDYSNLILEIDGCTESDERPTYKSGTGTKVVWSVEDSENDCYKIFYKSYSETKAMQTILVVYEVDNKGNKTGKVLTVLTEEGDVSFTKERFIDMTTSVVKHQEGVNIYQKEEGMTIPVLRYRFFNNGEYQVFYLYSALEVAPRVYDWDYYHQDGYRYSSFDHGHPRYDGKDVYSRYDQWGNTISRSLEAIDNSDNIEDSHNYEKLVISNYVLEDDRVFNGKNCKKGEMIIQYRNTNLDGSYNWNASAWTPTYCISPDGSKLVLI